MSTAGQWFPRVVTWALMLTGVGLVADAVSLAADEASKVTTRIDGANRLAASVIAQAAAWLGRLLDGRPPSNHPAASAPDPVRHLV